jgi:hypothetical protein
MTTTPAISAYLNTFSIYATTDEASAAQPTATQSSAALSAARSAENTAATRQHRGTHAPAPPPPPHSAVFPVMAWAAATLRSSNFATPAGEKRGSSTPPTLPTRREARGAAVTRPSSDAGVVVGGGGAGASLPTTFPVMEWATSVLKQNLNHSRGIIEHTVCFQHDGHTYESPIDLLADATVQDLTERVIPGLFPEGLPTGMIFGDDEQEFYFVWRRSLFGAVLQHNEKLTQRSHLHATLKWRRPRE